MGVGGSFSKWDQEGLLERVAFDEKGPATQCERTFQSKGGTGQRPSDGLKEGPNGRGVADKGGGREGGRSV